MKKNKKVIAIALMIMFLMTDIIPFIKANGQGELDNYLFLQSPTELRYDFLAKEECYMFAEIDNTDYLKVDLDGEEYVLSYGMNSIPLLFSGDLEEHTVLLSENPSDYIKSFVIEPLYLVDGSIQTSLNTASEINFKAGGLISLLLQPNFSYNWLYVEVDDITYKEIYPTDVYPEIDSQFYSYFVDEGTYCRFDLNLKPGEHTLKLEGNGTIIYKIVTNSDWDEDQLSDVDEIQKKAFYDLDPVIPNVWGFFQKSSGAVFWNYTEDPVEGKKEGIFNFFIPTNGNHRLTINIYNGNFSDFSIDGDTSILNEDVSANFPNTSINSILVNTIFTTIGWHYVQYFFEPGFNKISFRLNSNEIQLITPSELIDDDGDGVKDVDEVTGDVEINVEDTDNDGLPDTFDSSPFSSLTVNRNEVTQILIPTNKEKNSIITIQVKKPEKDYSTNGIPRFWRDGINVSITPVLRLFGNQYKFNQESSIMPLTKEDLTYLWGKEINKYSLLNEEPNDLDIGDALPPPANPNNETSLIHPIPSDKSIEYQINYPKNHPAKNDGIIDLRFDIIWLVTSYSVENGTNILHYYDMEENLTIQAMIHREITDLEYIIGAPDDFVENQALWALTQNPNLGSPENYNLQQDIIGKGTSDYFSIWESILNDVDYYYSNQISPINETQVVYIAGLYETSDILSDITALYDPTSDPNLFGVAKTKQYLSFYSVNDIYDNYRYGEEQLKSESKSLYTTYYNNLTSLSGIPIEMKIEEFQDAKVLSIVEAYSELIAEDEALSSMNLNLNEDMILQNKTYIVKKRYQELIPTINLDYENDEIKIFTNTQATQSETGKDFFDNSSTKISKFTIYNYYMSFLNISLGTLHNGLKYFYSVEGQQQYGSTIYDIFRDFSDLLDIYIKSDRVYFISLKNLDMDLKVELLDNLWNQLENLFIDIMLLDKIMKVFPEDGKISGVITKFITELKVVKALKTRFLSVMEKIKTSLKKFGSYINNKVNKLFTKASTWIKENIKKLCFWRKTKEGTPKPEGKGGSKFWKGVSFAISLISMLVELHKLLKIEVDNQEGVYANKTQMYYKEKIKSLGALVLDSISLFSSFVELFNLCAKSLEKVTKFTSYVTVAVTIVLTVIDWYFFINDFLGGSLSPADFIITLSMLIQETLVVIGLTIAVATKETVLGAVLGLAFAAFSFLTILLNPLINNVDFNVITSSSGFFLTEDTELNLRRHGGFEVGDLLTYRLSGIIISSNFVWIRSRFRLEGDDWIGDWTAWQGKWSSYFDKYSPGAIYASSFSSTILAATTDIKYSLSFQLDYDQIVFLIIFPYVIWVRTEGARQVLPESLERPALENTISEFYNNTREIVTTEVLKKRFENAKEEYRYKDAYDIATEIITRTEDQSKIIPSELENIIDNKQEYNDTYFIYQAGDATKFSNLIENHFNEGFRAECVNPELERDTMTSEELKYLHMISFSYASGFITFPKIWIYNKLEELGDANLYEEYRNELPLKTNILLNLGDNEFDIDSSSGKVDMNLKLTLVGLDNPLVNITLQTLPDFSVSPEMITQKLKEAITFTIEDTDKVLKLGLYMVNLCVYIKDTVIYQTNVPFRVLKFSNLILEPHQPYEPINPGEIFNLIDINNEGTVKEFIKLEIDGIPEDFIYEDLYPEPINNLIQYFTLEQGETRHCLVIKPPKCYNSTPGEYIYTLTLRNAYTDEIIEVYQYSFKLAEFYDLDFQCFNPEISILDDESCKYNFLITNLGNVIEEFIVSYTDVEIGLLNLEQDTFLLLPGQSHLFTIGFNPEDLGSENFIVTASSAHLSKLLLLKISVDDDDTDYPYLSIEPINCVSDQEPGSWKIISEDDSGLSEIRLLIDGIEHIFNQTDYGNGTIVQLLIPINNNLGEHTCTGLVIDGDIDRGSADQLLTFHPTVTCNIEDDDPIPPILSNLMIFDAITQIQIHFDAFDYSGFKEVKINIDNNFTITYNEFSISFDFSIFNEWIMDFGIHSVEIEVWDSDNDRLDDSLSSIIIGTFYISLEDMKQYVSWEISNLIERLTDTSEGVWEKQSYKATSIQKLEELITLIANNEFEGAYNKLLHDIMPKLTGLKTNEDEISWNKGEYKNYWITNETLQEICKIVCNQILKDIKTLDKTISSEEYLQIGNSKPFSYPAIMIVNTFYYISFLICLVSLAAVYINIRRKKKYKN